MPKARYEGIYRELRDRIQGGLYAYRDLLPTEKELTTEFSCSRNTLRRAPLDAWLSTYGVMSAPRWGWLGGIDLGLA